MTNRVQTLRSNVPGNRPPGGALPGTFYVNWADGQLGSVNGSNANQDLIAVRFFSSTANYNAGDHVIQGGQLYRANQSVAAGTFNPAQWSSLSVFSQYNPTFRNRIVNGEGYIDQRYEGATLTLPAATATYGPDKWKALSTIAAKFNLQRYTPSYTNLNISTAISATVPATPYTPAAGDQNIVYQWIEADTVRDFNWGTTNALPVVLSFWIIATVGGTYCVSLGNAASNRSYVASFTLATNAWTYVQLPIPPDTAGTWPTSGNAAWGTVRFDIGSGANFNAPAAGAWNAASYYTIAGAVRTVSNASASLNFTKVQLEVGTVATPFELVPPSIALERCQRYYEKSYPNGTGVGTVTNQGSTTAQFALIGLPSAAYTPTGQCTFKVQKRAVPTVTLYSPITANKPGYFTNVIGTPTDIAGSPGGTNVQGFNFGSVALPAAAGVNIYAQWTADADI